MIALLTLSPWVASCLGEVEFCLARADRPVIILLKVLIREELAGRPEREAPTLF